MIDSDRGTNMHDLTHHHDQRDDAIQWCGWSHECWYVYHYLSIYLSFVQWEEVKEPRTNN